MRTNTRLVDIPVGAGMALITVIGLLCIALAWLTEKAKYGMKFSPEPIIVVAILLVVVHVGIIVYWKRRTGKVIGLLGLFVSVGGLFLSFVELGVTQSWLSEMKGIVVDGRPGDFGDIAKMLAAYAFPIALPLGGLLVTFQAKDEDQPKTYSVGFRRWRHDYYDENDNADVVGRKHWCHCDQKYRQGVCGRCKQ